MDYREDPPRDAEEHFVLDSVIDQWLSFVMLREELNRQLEKASNQEQAHSIFEECMEITKAIEELPLTFKQYLFREF
jgi:hypothetical protein